MDKSMGEPSGQAAGMFIMMLDTPEIGPPVLPGNMLVSDAPGAGVILASDAPGAGHLLTRD